MDTQISRNKAQMTDEEFIEKIKDCIARGVTLKYQIAEELNMTWGQFAYRFRQVQAEFPALENQRQQRKEKDLQRTLLIVKGLMQYGFQVQEISDIMGYSFEYVNKILKESGLRKQIIKADADERFYMPRHSLISSIFKTATSGKTTIPEIAQELGISETTIEQTIVWLSKRKMWYSSSQLDGFRKRIENQEYKKTYSLRNLLKAAKKEEDDELDTLIGSADKLEERPARKKGKVVVSTKKREAYLDYICQNKALTISSIRSSSTKNRNAFFDEIVDMMDLNPSLVTVPRVEGLIKVATAVGGLEFALILFRRINNNLVEIDNIKVSESIQPIKQGLMKQIVTEQGNLMRKNGLSDAQIADQILKRYRIRMSPTDIFLALSASEVSDEKDRD